MAALHDRADCFKFQTDAKDEKQNLKITFLIR